MKKYCGSFITFTILSTSFAAEQRRTVECQPTETAELNRFNLSGFVDSDEKGQTHAELKATVQMAGKDAASIAYSELAFTGTSRKYPAKTLGYKEVSLVRLHAEAQGHQIQLIIASGLMGPQSTLVIGTIPFRAECKLGSFLK